MELQPIKKNLTLKEQAYVQIRQAINTNELKPGTALTEEQLSSMLSISRTPIRSALQQLVYEKLLSQDATGHIFVTKITPKNVSDTSKVRIVLECMALDSAIFPIPDEKLNLLEQLLKEQTELVQKQPDDNLGFSELDKEFHCALASCCDNETLLEFIRTINNVMVRTNVLSGTLPHNRQNALEEHSAILRYLKNGQKDYAKLALSDHLKHVEERMLG